MSTELATKYLPYVDELFSQESKKSILTNEDFDFDGAKTVKLYKVNTAEMNDYGRTGATGSNWSRYGAVANLEGTCETATLKKDRSFTFVIDALDENQTGGALNGATALARQVREVVIPEVDGYVYGVMAAGAGHKPAAVALTKDNIYDEIIKASAALDDDLVPETDRALTVTPATYLLMKKCKDIVMETEIGEEMRIRGVIANLDGAMTIKVTASRLPENFKKYAANISVKTSSVQYENDDVMRPVWGDDYSICCCVSATETGKEMQFFGARANLAKCLLYAINGGVDEKTGQQVGPEYKPITSEYLDYDEVMHKYDIMMDWLAGLYVNTLNLIQYMHDKYYYEYALMALIDTNVRRTFATGIAGFSHVVDSLSAIKYAKVKTVRNEDGLVVDYETTGDFPKYGNDDDRADDIAVWLLQTFMKKLEKFHTYRDSEPTTSILTITSNVVYGKATGSLPDGRKAGEPLSPGANPSYGAEQNGLLASLNSVAKLPYEWALDGISNTQTINPDALGHSEEERIGNLVNVMDGYFAQGAHHLNVNVFGVEKLIDAMEHPEKEEYANFTIRVSGYAVKFISLTKEQQLDVIARTCHDRM